MIFELLKNFWFVVFSTISFSIVNYNEIGRIFESHCFNHSAFWRMMVYKDNPPMSFGIYFIPIFYKSYPMLTTLKSVFKCKISGVIFISNQFSIHKFTHPMKQGGAEYASTAFYHISFTGKQNFYKHSHMRSIVLAQIGI